MCYLCGQEDDGEHLCQDCGAWYCDICFDTPCHDLCRTEARGVHYTSSDCPHFKDRHWRPRWWLADWVPKPFGNREYWLERP